MSMGLEFSRGHWLFQSTIKREEYVGTDCQGLRRVVEENGGSEYWLVYQEVCSGRVVKR